MKVSDIIVEHSKEEFKRLRAMASEIRQVVTSTIDPTLWHVDNDWRDTGLTFIGDDKKKGKDDLDKVIRKLKAYFTKTVNRPQLKKIKHMVQGRQSTQFRYAVTPEITFGHWDDLQIGRKVSVADFFLTIG